MKHIHSIIHSVTCVTTHYKVGLLSEAPVCSNTYRCTASQQLGSTDSSSRDGTAKYKDLQHFILIRIGVQTLTLLSIFAQ